MSDLRRIIRIIVGAAPWRLALGLGLSLIVLLAGAGLLGLSGWFIAAAGVAGTGIALSVMRPSAGVRAFALGRTAARYGERIVTHDATLRALTALRVALMRGALLRDARTMARLRGEESLTRLTADVDALDGVILRLLVPVIAGLATHVIVFAILVWLAGVGAALMIAVPYLIGGGACLIWLARRGFAPSARAEAEAQALREGTIEAVRDREALVIAGALPERLGDLQRHDAAARGAAVDLDRTERLAGFGLAAAVSVAATGALIAGGWGISRGHMPASTGTIGVFVALALGETLLPLRRGFAELGKLIRAAKRIDTPQAHPTQTTPQAHGPVLHIPDLGLDLHRGDCAALTGPSGAGKTTLLMQIAGLADTAPGAISVLGHAPRDWPEQVLRQRIAVLPQRASLVRGTVRDNMTLAADCDDETLWAALEVVDLAGSLRAREGLETLLGEGGAGLSGGQSKRLALARILLNSPDLLLLDEPTEGLDAQTARLVLDRLPLALPETTILATLHRDAEHPVFSKIFRI